jgi:hypothetical protein
MANNPYYEENSGFGSVLKGASFAGAAGASYMAYKNPEATTRVFNRVVNSVAPLKAPELNPYQSNIVSAREAIFSTMEARNIRRVALDKDMQARALQTIGNVNNWGTVSAVGAGIKGGKSDSFKSLTDILDIEGNEIGTKIHNALEKRFNSKIDAPKFSGTRGTWKIAGEDLSIDFSKKGLDSGLGNSWFKRVGESYYASPYQSKMANRGGGKLGYDVMSPNEFVLNVLQEENAGSGRLAYVESPTKFRNAYEKVIGEKVTGLSGHDDAVKYAVQQVRKEIELGSNASVSNVRTMQKALKKVFNTDTMFVETDPVKLGLFGSEVRVEEYSRYILGNTEPEFKGVGSNRVGRNMNSLTGGSVNIEGNALKVAYNIPHDARTDSSLIRIVNGSGATLKSKNATFMQKMMSLFGGYRLGQDPSSEFAWAVRPTVLPVIAEGDKSMKGALWADDNTVIRKNGTQGISMGKEYFRGTGTKRIEAHRLETLRHMSFIDDTKITEAAASSSDYVKGKIYSQQNKGIYNMTMALNPFSEESIQVSSGMSKHMKVLIPKTATVDTIALKGEESYRRSLLTLMDANGVLDKESFTIKEIMESKALSERVSTGQSKIKIGRGTYLGRKNIGMEISNAEDFYSTFERDGEIIKAKVDMYIDSTDFNQMVESNQRMMGEGHKHAGGVKYIAKAMDDPAKVALTGIRARGAYAVGDDGLLNSLYASAGLGNKQEATISLGMFKKTFPKISNNSLLLGKDSPELLHFTQSALGWQSLQSSMDITLSKNAADHFVGKYVNDASKVLGNQDYYTGRGASKKFSFSKAMRDGAISFTQRTESDAAFAQQYQDTVQVLGTARREWGNNRKVAHIESFSTTNAKDAAKVIDNQIEAIDNMGKLAKGEYAVRLFNKQVDAKELGEQALVRTRVSQGSSAGLGSTKALTMGILGGLQPQEQNWLALGGEFNKMRISWRDMYHFTDKADILRDISVRSLTDADTSATMIKLMSDSAVGHNVTSAVNAFEKKYGKIPKLKKTEEILEMIGGDAAMVPGAIRDPEFLATKSFLGNKKNEFGFMVEMGERNVYIPGRDVWKGYATDEGMATFDSLFAETHNLLLNKALGSNIHQDRDEYQNWVKRIINETGSSKEGLQRTISLSIDHAVAAKHIEDPSFIHNKIMIGAMESWKGNADKKLIPGYVAKAEALENTFGNIAKIGEKDFSSSIKQLITDTKTIASSPGSRQTMQEVLTSQYGEDHFLQKYANRMSANMDKEGVASLVKDITTDHVASSKLLMSKIKEYASTGNESLFGEIDTLVGGAHKIFAVRHPTLYTGSYSGLIALIDSQIEGTQKIAIAHRASKNMASDWDGDTINYVDLRSKLGRQKALNLINTDQKIAYGVMSSKVQDRMTGILTGKGTNAPSEALAFFNSLDSPAALNTVAKNILHDAPGSTAISSYFTNAMTGQFNISAMETKNYIRDLSDSKNLSQEHMKELGHYFGVMASKNSEQEVISAKHAETWLKNMNKSESKMNYLTNLIGAQSGQEQIAESIRELGSVHPIAQMAAMNAKGKDNEKFAGMVSDFMDFKVGWKQLEQPRFETMWEGLGLEKSHGVNTSAAWDMYDSWLKEGEHIFGNKMESSVAAGISELSYLEVTKQAMFDKRSSASESIEAMFSRALEFMKMSDNDRAGDAAMGVLDKLGYRKTALQMLTLHEQQSNMAQATRKIAGFDTVSKAAQWMVEKPVRLAGAVGIGLLGMTAINLLSGDGGLEDPNDLPSVSNPAFTGGGGNGMMNTHGVQPHVGVNANVNLLTDSNDNPQSALSYISNMFGYSQGSVVSVMHDGENPYKKDMMYYN